MAPHWSNFWSRCCLAGIAIAGSLSALAHVQRSWHEAARLGRMHERAQYVFGTLEPELQMAGYFGTGARPRLSATPSAAVLASCGSGALLPLQPAARVLEGNWQLPCPAQGQGAKPGSDVLMLRRASTRIATTQDGALQLPGSSLQPEPRELFVRIFYVARAADGDARTPALRVKSLTAVAGKPAFVDTEVMPGVEDLQAELLPDATAPRLVRIQLHIRADADDVRAGEAPPVLELERRFNLRNAGS